MPPLTPPSPARSVISSPQPNAKAAMDQPHPRAPASPSPCVPPHPSNPPAKAADRRPPMATPSTHAQPRLRETSACQCLIYTCGAPPPRNPHPPASDRRHSQPPRPAMAAPRHPHQQRCILCLSLVRRVPLCFPCCRALHGSSARCLLLG
jgi:hypothetical protein